LPAEQTTDLLVVVGSYYRDKNVAPHIVPFAQSYDHHLIFQDDDSRCHSYRLSPKAEYLHTTCTLARIYSGSFPIEHIWESGYGNLTSTFFCQCPRTCCSNATGMGLSFPK
jgi:hypothetical protein